MGENDVNVQVAVLQQIAAHTAKTLDEIKLDVREMRQELRQDIERVRIRQERDFRLLFGTIITTTLGLAALIGRIKGWI